MPDLEHFYYARCMPKFLSVTIETAQWSSKAIQSSTIASIN